MSFRTSSANALKQTLKQAIKPVQAQRSYSILARAAVNAAVRPQVARAGIAATRGVKTLDFAGTQETVYERSDWPAEKLQEYFKNDTLAMIGYGSQGHGQSLNARDNGLKVIVGVRKDGESWRQAQEDGWVPGETLFSIEEAIGKGTIIMNLLSDAAQSQTWGEIKPLITEGKTLYFSHGFSVVYKEDTGVIPPPNVDVILVAPKGSGRTVRTLFLEGRGINGSIAVHQDVTGKAMEKARAMAVAVGTGYAYETTFEKEVYSDLYGERGVLMGGIQGMFLAQYQGKFLSRGRAEEREERDLIDDHSLPLFPSRFLPNFSLIPVFYLPTVLRENGHSPSEAFNETVEEATQSLFPLIGAHGMDYMYNACSTTARRGALDWAPQFYEANRPVFEKLYSEVRNGNETRRSLSFNGQKDYREKFAAETAEIDAQEIWRAGKTVRKLRPDYKGDI